MTATLRAFEMADAQALHQLLNHPDLVECRYTDENRDLLSLRQVEDLIGKWIKAERETHLLITEEDVAVGIATADPSWEPLAPFVSVVIDPARQRQGLGTAALDLLLVRLFKSTPALAAMTWVDDWNESGLAFAAAYGFREAGRPRREGIRDGSYFDAVGFDLTREEWEANHGH